MLPKRYTSLISILSAIAIISLGTTAYAQVTVPGGGTGITSVPAGAFVVGSSQLRLTSTTSPTAGYFTATSTSHASTFPLASTTQISATSLCLSGICYTSITAAGGTFSTTSASYFLSVNQGPAFSTSSASYFLSQNQGAAFSTTSADYWQSQRNFFSTTSADAWKAQRNFFSTTSADAWINLYGKGFFFSTSSADYHVSASSTIAKTTLGYVWNALQTFASGIISQASSTIAVLHLGTPLEVQSGGTASTTLTGILKGNGTSAVQSAVAGSDYEVPLTFTYPVLRTGNTVALQFGTTTANSWSALQSFSNATSTLFTATNAWITNATSTNISVSGNASSSRAIVSSLVNCDTIDTNAAGLLTCGTDNTAAGAFATSSADYWLTQRQGSAFSTTSADAWETTKWRWSTTSTDYWKTQNNFFSTTSVDAWEATKWRWATTSSDYWQTQRNFFSTTSADAWEATKWRWSTSSALGFDQALGDWNVVNGAYLTPTTTLGVIVNASSTFTGKLNLINASTTNFTASAYASTSRFFADGLVTCNTGNMLTWSGGVFGCEDDTTGAGSGADPFSHPSANVSATTSGLIISASSTISSGLFTMSGGASSTNITASGAVYTGAGAVGSPAVSVSDGGGLYRIGANSLGLTNGVSGLTWDGSAFKPNTDVARWLGLPASRWAGLSARDASTTNATTTNLEITGNLTFNGVMGSTWAAFCTTITGGSGLCDGSDATGSGGSAAVATSSGETRGQLAYWTSTNGTPATLGTTATGTVSCSGNILCASFAGIGSNSSISFTGTLAISNGGTGTSTNASYGNVLAWNGVNFQGFATSSLYSGNNGQVMGFANGVFGPISTSSCIEITKAAGLCDGDDATGGGGGSWPFTPDFFNGAAAQSTTTPFWAKNSMLIASTTFFTQASTTMFTNSGATFMNGKVTMNAASSTDISVSNSLFVNFAGGLLYSDVNKQVRTQATSSLSATSPLTGSFVQVGTGGSLGIQAASASQSGSMSSTDFQRLYTATSTFTWPLTWSGSTNAVTFNGLATTTPWNQGELVFVSGTNKNLVGSVATGTVSAGSSAITATAGRSVIGGALTIDCAAAGSGQNGCLGSGDWTNMNGKLGSSTISALTANFLPKWNTTAFANSQFFDDGSYAAVGTSTPKFGMFTIGSSTAPELILTDNRAANPNWAFNAMAGNLYLATSTATATSTNTALQINTNGLPALQIGTSSSAGILNLGSQQSTNGTSTIMMGKIQIDGYNTTGSRVCVTVVGTTLTVGSGACTP